MYNLFSILAPVAKRLHMVALFSLVSALVKVCEMERVRFNKQDVTHCVGCVPNPYVTLNQRYMNKKWREEEEELEKFL